MPVYRIYVPTWTLFKVEAENAEAAKQILLRADDPMD
jgi:hypothetical protein